MAKPTGRPVRDEILREARQLIQQVGVGAFSYSDLAERIGVKAPSIHHHFRYKEDLVAEVVRIYRDEFNSSVTAIPPGAMTKRLEAYASLFTVTASAELMCLCGAVAAEWQSVGSGSRDQVDGFFSDQVEWLRAQLAEGVASGQLRRGVDPGAMATSLLAALEGATLMSRSGREPQLPSSVGALLVSLAAEPS